MVMRCQRSGIREESFRLAQDKFNYKRHKFFIKHFCVPNFSYFPSKICCFLPTTNYKLLTTNLALPDSLNQMMADSGPPLPAVFRPFQGLGVSVYLSVYLCIGVKSASICARSLFFLTKVYIHIFYHTSILSNYQIFLIH